MNKSKYKIKHKVLDILLVAIILISLSSIALADDNNLTVGGYVYTENKTDDGSATYAAGVEGVTVTIWYANHTFINSSTTNDTGWYSMDNIPNSSSYPTEMNHTFNVTTVPGNYMLRGVGVNTNTTSNIEFNTSTENFAVERVWNASGYAKSYNGTGITGAKATYNTTTTGFANYDTTTSTGYYMIYGIRNGSDYIFNASKTVTGGLSTSPSVTQAFRNGVDVTNLNFSMDIFALSGFVRDGSLVALEGATVSYLGSTIATSNSLGAWSIPEAINLTYSLTAAKTGYVSETLSYVILGAANTVANFRLYAGSAVSVASRQKIQDNTFSGFTLASIAAFILIAMGILGLVLSFVGTISGGGMASSKEIITFSMAALIVGILLLVMSTIMEMITLV